MGETQQLCERGEGRNRRLTREVAKKNLWGAETGHSKFKGRSWDETVQASKPQGMVAGVNGVTGTPGWHLFSNEGRRAGGTRCEAELP